MVPLKKIFLIFPLFWSLSCAKIGYLYKQGKGQLRLIYQGRPNQEVLEDPAVSPKDKEKIKKIIQYKKWFYAYWGDKESNIYNKTTLLKDRAVSYLVIASPFDRIEAKKECFPLMGCFPYLGYFNQEDARQRAKKLEKDDWITWIRPVYAYSSLGKLNDPILSSFFHYDDRELAELVFHELFHSLFFVKNEVELNENLANFFATQLRALYFKEPPSPKKHEFLHEPIRKHIKKLNTLYAKEKNPSKNRAEQILKDFLKTQFRPSLLKHCQHHKIHPCRIANHQGWNNARFAAFLTYQNQEKRIQSLYRRLNKENSFSIKKFFLYIKNRYNDYKKGKESSSFDDYLLKPV